MALKITKSYPIPLVGKGDEGNGDWAPGAAARTLLIPAATLRVHRTYSLIANDPVDKIMKILTELNLWIH
jgi:hypothetical protein